MARPRKIVDETKLRNLALIGCSIETMARNLNVSRDTLERRCRGVIEEARGDAESRLLSKCYQSALKGNTRLLELSLVNRCGWALRPETIVNVTQNAGPPPETYAQMRPRLEAASKFAQRWLAENGNGS